MIAMARAAGRCVLFLLVAFAVAGTGGRRAATEVARSELAGHESYTEVLPGTGVSFDLVAIPGGTFLRGSAESEPGRRGDERPRHRVALRPFWMSRTEVTWDLYDLYLNPAARRANFYDLFRKLERKPRRDEPQGADAITRPSPPYIDEYRGFGRDGYPVVGVSHHTAMEFCRWLSWKTGKSYRLPTEAEWEYACRAGTRTAYSFGDSPERLGDYAWIAKNSDESTHPVGRKKPNPWGLYDMHGNVAEWCLDQYDAGAYAAFPPERAAVAPVRLPTAARYPHVARGGSWLDGPERCRSAARLASDKSWNQGDPQVPPSIWWLADVDYVGFRVVRAVEEQENLRGFRSRTTRQSE